MLGYDPYYLACEGRVFAVLAADQAEAALAAKRIGKTTEAFKAYSQGKLPPKQIDNRARRYAVKMFLSHFHNCWWREAMGTEPPKPFALEHCGHAHYIAPPQVKP